MSFPKVPVILSEVEWSEEQRNAAQRCNDAGRFIQATVSSSSATNGVAVLEGGDLQSIFDEVNQLIWRCGGNG